MSSAVEKRFNLLALQFHYSKHRHKMELVEGWQGSKAPLPGQKTFRKNISKCSDCSPNLVFQKLTSPDLNAQ